MLLHLILYLEVSETALISFYPFFFIPLFHLHFNHHIFQLPLYIFLPQLFCYWLPLGCFDLSYCFIHCSLSILQLFLGPCETFLVYLQSVPLVYLSVHFHFIFQEFGSFYQDCSKFLCRWAVISSWANCFCLSGLPCSFIFCIFSVFSVCFVTVFRFPFCRCKVIVSL